MTRSGGFALLAVLALAAALGGCRADEQNRPLHFDKGKYEGKQDESLSADQLKALRERAELAR